MCISCELHKMQLALNIKNTVCLDCVWTVCSLFVVKLACVYSKTGFRFRLQPPIAHEISSPETGFSRQCEDIYACECWDLFECVTTQEAEGCLSICRLLFFFFFFSYRCIFWHGCVLAFSKPRNVPIMCSRSWATLITDVFSQLQWWYKEPESKRSAADPVVSVWYVFLFSNSVFFLLLGPRSWSC